MKYSKLIKALKVVSAYLPDMPTLDKMIKEELEAAWKDVDSHFDLVGGENEAEPIEYKRRDGFIPHTQGGYEIFGFADLYTIHSEGIEDNKADKAIDDALEYDMELVKETMWDKYKEELKEEGINSAKEVEYGKIDSEDLLRKYEETESDIMAESPVMLRMGVYYYEPRNEDDDHSVYVFSEVNLEAPYYRPKYGITTFKEDIDFEDAGELRPVFKKALENAVKSLIGNRSKKPTTPEREKAPVIKLKKRA